MELDEFWRNAEISRLETRFRLAKEMSLISRLDIDALRKILFQYRFFTSLFATDIAVLITRCQPGTKLRSLLAELLNEELGEGDPNKAHAQLFDRFLLSLGCFPAGTPTNQLDARIHPEVAEILNLLARQTQESSEFYAIGLRGMGGECVCGVYFGVMFDHLKAHPYIVANDQDITWEFWDIHAGHADLEHNHMVRAAVAELLTDECEENVDQLAAGFQQGTALWDLFWRSIFSKYLEVPAAEPRIRGWEA